MSWKTHGATPRDNTQKVANATVTKKSNMPSKSELLIHMCLYKGSCWVGTLGTARHKASLPPPPPIGGTARHGTKQGGTRRFRPPPLPMPTALWAIFWPFPGHIVVLEAIGEPFMKSKVSHSWHMTCIFPHFALWCFGLYWAKNGLLGAQTGTDL